MSFTQDPLRFFKILLPKNPTLSPKILSLLNNFETNLTVSIKELIPKDRHNVLTVSWMIQAIKSLCKTHENIKTLVTSLEPDFEEELICMYSDVSLKLLELCNAFTSELDRLNHNNLLLKFAFTKLDINYLDEWNHHIGAKNPRIEKCGAVLSSLHDHHLPKKTMKKKKCLRRKVLFRAIYGVKVKTLYIFGLFTTAFSSSCKNLYYITLPKEIEKEVPWAQAFMELQNVINPEIKNSLLLDRYSVVKDLEDVETGVKKLYYTLVQQKEEEEGEGLVLDLVEPLKKLVMELSENFDIVSKEIRCFTKIVISTRDALSESLWKKYGEEMGVTLMPLMIKSVETYFVNRETCNYKV